MNGNDGQTPGDAGKDQHDNIQPVIDDLAHHMMTLASSVSFSFADQDVQQPVDLGRMGRLFIGVGNCMIGSARRESTSEAGPHIDADGGRPLSARMRESTQADRRAIDGQDKLDPPTPLSLDAGAFVEDDCPMLHCVAANATEIALGDNKTLLCMQFSDQALINLAQLANRAVHDMLRARGKPVPDWANRELD